MEEQRPREGRGPAGLPARPAGSEAALPDGGRRAVVVAPDDVWTAPAPAPPVTEATVREAAREARRSFLAPIVMVVALSAALLLLFMAAVALLVWLRS